MLSKLNIAVIATNTQPAMTDAISQALKDGNLPADKHELLCSLVSDNGSYTTQEGVLWDFKRDWPFSYSDDYFGGIARLIAAFANTHGGIIIFGVHDETRTAGRNKVSPNLDRLQQSLNQLLTDSPQVACRRYAEGTSDAVDVLLVCPLKPTTLPTRFKRTIGPYKAGTIWVRQNHEVVAAEPRHAGLLYCRHTGDEETGDNETLSGGLPPSPANIKRFVGRLSTIDRIFGWLKQSDEPRTFLHGKGGSGKTTIAYEIAKTLKLEGSGVRIHGGELLDNVIFVSAKQRTLDVIDQSTKEFVGLDFLNEKELYEAILTLANWSSHPIDDLSLDDLKQEIKNLFDLTSNFIVIDDIDTLTTKGIEAGFDFLYSVLWRSKRRSKVLYTIRNAPTQSLANSIEVPGLEDGDYEEFVQVCARQFKVPPPDSAFVSHELSAISERRPLVIESIVALRRTSGNYSRALQLFQESSGDDARNYVFQREWNSLPADNYGRYLLAVLALHGDPLTFSDISALTRYEDRRVHDALAEVREMFLQLNEVGAETTFQLGALTRAFVLDHAKKLERYSALKERVEKYKRNFYPENPILSRLRDRVEAQVIRGRHSYDKETLKEALRTVMDPSISPRITEDPRFISLQAYVYANQIPPNLEDARRLFGHVFTMKFEPDIDHLKTWFHAERDSGHGLDQCIKIADFICEGKKYGDVEKIEFLSRKGTCLYNRGKNEIQFSPQGAISDILEALRCHLNCYTRNFKSGSIKTEKSEGYAKNTAFYLFTFLVLHGRHDDFFDFVLLLCNSESLKLDPLEDGLLRALEYLQRERGTRADINRVRGRLEYLRKEIDKSQQWYDQYARQRVIDRISSTSATLGQALKGK